MAQWEVNAPVQGQRTYGATTVDRAQYDVGLRAHMLRVYNYMASGLALSGIVALVLFSTSLGSIFFKIGVTPSGAQRLIGLNVLGWIALFAPVVLILIASFRQAQMSVGSARLFYWAIVATFGIGLAPVLFVYTGASVARTFFVTAAAFAALSLYGYTTRRSLSGFGTFLFMGLIGILIAGVVNIFLASSMLHFMISAAGVLIFAGLTAYDTQAIKEQYSEAYGSDVQEKVAIFGALSLYLDFVNLFQFLLAFLGDRD
ncbi:MAG: Bax inhibitor-1/YccA family protein [Alphaproteobacteria bacterium]|nr:Bax inhibitor-1/YccA family protein [Alphaproteobacteria bacterium]